MLKMEEVIISEIALLEATINERRLKIEENEKENKLFTLLSKSDNEIIKLKKELLINLKTQKV